MSAKWTAETEELVANATAAHWIVHGRTDADGNNPCVCDRWWDSEHGPGWDEHMAEVTLTALADAGLLLLPGGKTRIERGMAVPDGVSPCSDRCQRERGHTHDRERTVHVGPWVPVNDGGGA